MNNKLVMAVALMAIVSAAVVVTQAGQYAQGGKTAVAGDDVRYLESASTTEAALGSTIIHVPSQKDLVVALTAEAVLFTNTTIKGTKTLDYQTSQDTASIQVWVNATSLTGTYTDTAFPGEVTFAERIQTLSGRLNWGIKECDDGSGYLCFADIPQEITLALDTTNANGFNFILMDLPSGDYKITAYARISEEESGDNPSGDVRAAVGKRTMVVYEANIPTTGDNV